MSIQTLAAVLPGSTTWWSSPTLLFVIVVVAASCCVLTAAAVLLIAWRDDLAELGLIGAFTMSVSLLPLIHGLTTPGVLYGPNSATSSSVFWALPLASIAVTPLAAPASQFARWLAHRWRPFVMMHGAATVALSAALLTRPELVPAPALGAGAALPVAIGSLSVCFALSLRQLRLSWISGTMEPFMVSIGFAFVGVSNLVWVARAPFTPGFWLAHVFDVAGVFLVSIGAAVAFRQRSNLSTIIRPLTVHTPLAAFELGLDPLVHRFVASLDEKDPITRDHVVRTAEMAMMVGTQLGLPAHELHVLGLGALLHDVGKLAIPTEIITKAGRLDEAEYSIIRGHAAAGESLVRASMVLAPIGPIVRWHHERIDGRGYPDGLTGAMIPRLARIVSACDGYDAMANTRQYREGMGQERAIAILREHAGSQWDSQVVEALVVVVRRAPRHGAALAQVGRSNAIEQPVADRCGCFDAAPEMSA